MKNFPVLYTKTSTGAIQFWEIQAEKMHDLCDSQIQVGVIETTYGHLGTDKPQKSTDYIKEGKNIGKANATTPYEQACKEAEAKWIKQKKGGYVETKEGAEAGERDALIKGGVDPMLAHSYMDVIHDLRPGLEGNVSYELTKDAKKIKFPAFAQPKLDGIRCEGEFTGAMWSRTRKVIPHLPHLREAIARAAGELAVGEFLDGELYNHAYKNDFEKITSAVGQKDAPSPDHELVEFHVYDLVTHTPFNFKERQRALDRMGVGSFANIKRVETVVVNSHKELMSYFEKCLALGYEGCMVRNGNSLYEAQRLPRRRI
jgi:DNA ligase-1